MCRTMLRSVIWINLPHSVCCRPAGSQRITPPPPLPLAPPLPPPHPLWLTPSPSPSSSDTSSWQPAPFNSLQHSLGPGNQWFSAPSAATTPAPLLVGLSHLGPYDGAFPRGVFLLPKTAQRCCEKREENHDVGDWVKSLKFSSPQMFALAGNALYH